MTQAELISMVEARCHTKAKKVYIDPTTVAKAKAMRIKLLGARITDDNLKELYKEVIGKQADGKTITKVSRNDHSTGGFYTSVEDVCIYLQ